ncbi:MAG: helix-turn-helix transcriptional regulator [Oscillospiraceae bacterium]|nr:helix-turn-helix transcriptional regulator [Oscillospiraceae bacterium]MBR6954353.1 helix-turn-helix transcriptional regulator [Clostridia bacterium]
MDTRQPDEDSKRQRFPSGFRILHGQQEYISYAEHASIRIWPSFGAGYYNNHNHSAIEITLVHKGEAHYTLPEDVYHVKAGEILLIPSGCPHELREADTCDRHLLLFEPGPIGSLRDVQSINTMTQQVIYLREDSELRRGMTELLMKAVDCYFRKQPMYNAECYGYLMQVYALLGRHYLETAAPQAAVRHSTIDPEIMNSAITYIGEHYMEPITLDSVADFVGFSKYYFSRTFKEYSGVTFTDFLLVKRLNAAVNYLIRSDRPIRDVARMSGFGSVATFNRVFREQKNCTPTQFRAIYGSTVNPDPNRRIF